MDGKRCIAVLIAACAVAVPCMALSVNEVDANASALLIGTFPPTDYGTANPAVTQLLGAGLPLRISGPFFVEPVVELFGMLYEWTYDHGTAVPTGVERAGQFFTLGTLISLQAGLEFPLSSVVSIGGALGLDFLLRFPVDWWDTDTSSTEGRDPSLAYFFDKGRFFYPETRLFLRWGISKPIDLLFNVRAYYPLFHAWDGENKSFFDQFMLSVGLGFGIKLGSEQQPAAQPTTATGSSGAAANNAATTPSDAAASGGT